MKELTVARKTKLAQKVLKYARAAKSANTLRAYSAAMDDFREFCQDHGANPLPASPETVIAYLVWTDEQKVSTIQIKLAAIAEAHRVADLPNPTTDEHVKTVMAGIRRELGTAVEKKEPITRQHLIGMTATLPADLRGKRDRAILLVGFAGAFRRSELVDLRVEDLAWTKDAVMATVRRSKGDQTGKGLIKVIPAMNDKALCPVSALRSWLTASQITSGPIFRKVDRWEHVSKTALAAQCVALIVKESARRCQLNPNLFSAHSLRSGFVTSAFAADAPEWAIQKQTGHKNLTVLRDYNQDKGKGASRAAKAALGGERNG